MLILHMKRFIIIAIIFIVIVTMVFGISSFKKSEKDNGNISYEDLSNYFSGYEGCIILFDRNKEHYTIFNQAKSEQKISISLSQSAENKIDDISGGISKMGLQSSFKLSAKEQVELLRKFRDYQLPVSKETIEKVKSMILLSDENGIRLYGKSGIGESGDKSKTEIVPVNGWFDGYVEKDNNVYFFATNIEADKNGIDREKAKEITLKILRDKNLY